MLLLLCERIQLARSPQVSAVQASTNARAHGGNRQPSGGHSLRDVADVATLAAAAVGDAAESAAVGGGWQGVAAAAD